MKGLYQFYWNCGRMGHLEGVFVADSEDVAKILGQDVYFGEVLGKHSEVYGTINEGDIELKTTSPEFIELFEELALETGYSPFNYWEPEEEEAEEE